MIGVSIGTTAEDVITTKRGSVTQTTRPGRFEVAPIDRLCRTTKDVEDSSDSSDYVLRVCKLEGHVQDEIPTPHIEHLDITLSRPSSRCSVPM